MPKITVCTPTIRPKGLDEVFKSLEQQTFTDFEWLTEVSIPLLTKYDVNAAYNRMIKRAKGELFVSYQDYIRVRPDFLNNLWVAYQEHPNVFFTCPVGKTLNWYDVKWDWRKHPDAQIDERRWEIDLGSCPMKALWEIGGFDEYLDQWWSFDNVDVGIRAKQAGYEFGVLIDNGGIAWDHDAMIQHPLRERFNPEEAGRRIMAIEAGLKIDYLKN